MSIAATVRERVEHSPTDLITLQQFRDLSADAVNAELRRMVARGALAHPRRGVYTRGDARAHPNPYELLYGLARGRVYPIADTAAHLLGIRQVPPAVSEYATTRGEVITLPGPQVRMLRRLPRRRSSVEPLEAGLLDILGDVERHVSVSEQVQVLPRLLAWLDGHPDAAVRLAAAVSAESPRCRARVDALLAMHAHTSAIPDDRLGPLSPQLRLL